MISGDTAIHDLAMGLITATASFGVLKFWDFLAAKKVFSQVEPPSFCDRMRCVEMCVRSVANTSSLNPVT
jgi:hypothetical protein